MKKHVHQFKYKKLNGGEVRRSCTTCPCVIIDVAQGKITVEGKKDKPHWLTGKKKRKESVNLF